MHHYWFFPVYTWSIKLWSIIVCMKLCPIVQRRRTNRARYESSSLAPPYEYEDEGRRYTLYVPTSTTGSTTAGTMVLIFEWLLVIFRWLRGACNLSRRGLSRWLREWARSIHTRRSFSVNDSQMMFHFSCLWRSYNIFGILIKISYWSNFRRFLCSVSQCKSRLCKRRISPVCWMKQGKLSEHHTTLIVT